MFIPCISDSEGQHLKISTRLQSHDNTADHRHLLADVRNTVGLVFYCFIRRRVISVVLQGLSTFSDKYGSKNVYLVQRHEDQSNETVEITHILKSQLHDVAKD